MTSPLNNFAKNCLSCITVTQCTNHWFSFKSLYLFNAEKHDFLSQMKHDMYAHFHWSMVDALLNDEFFENVKETFNHSLLSA